MEKPLHPTINKDLITLRADIKRHYLSFHQQDKDRFPAIEYNTSRTNYQPLKDSFEEEFFVKRGLDRMNNNLHIPSTNTLVLLFTDNTYVPSRKILHTCQSYVAGKTEDNQPETTPIEPPVPKNKHGLLTRTFLLGLGLGIIAVGSIWLYKPAPNGLLIEQPNSNSVVPQTVLIEGEVNNASEVWVVVRSMTLGRCWVQPVIKVQENGWWTGNVFIGGLGNQDIGHHYQIRAFVNPNKKLVVEQTLNDWPQAELSTSAIEVIRGSK